MTYTEGNHSPRNSAAALKKIEAELRSLDSEALSLQGGVTGHNSSSMLRSARSLNVAAAGAGLSAVADVSGSLESLLQGWPGATAADGREYVESLLYRIDVLRLLMEQESQPQAVDTGVEGFIRDFEAAVAVLEGGEPGARMAA